MLFYEKRLSKNNIQACADCHLQIDGFSDINQFSTGVEGLQGGRQAMAIMNMAWHDEGFFWDGRASTLRDQALRPIQDPLEMNETLENVIAKLSADVEYKNQFLRAFGSNQVSAERISLALEQFMFTLISANSRYDKYLLGQETMSPAELRGKDLFFSEFDPFGTERGAECFHCHGGPDFSNHAYMNNGLDTEENFTDEGRFAVTGDPFDMAAFKVPSLRNIAVTAPYMHDGRFNTLEEVIEHYNTGVQQSSSVHPLLQFNLDPGLDLSQEEIADIVAFLHTLTDEEFLTNEEFSDPH
jgi:cytochrome c peroxidase